MSKKVSPLKYSISIFAGAGRSSPLSQQAALCQSAYWIFFQQVQMLLFLPSLQVSPATWHRWFSPLDPFCAKNPSSHSHHIIHPVAHTKLPVDRHQCKKTTKTHQQVSSFACSNTPLILPLGNSTQRYTLTLAHTDTHTHNTWQHHGFHHQVVRARDCG